MAPSRPNDPVTSTPDRIPTREVHTHDAIAWLNARGMIAGASVITSLPDVTELRPMSLAQWQPWFVHAAGLCATATDPAGLTVFYQTDAKIDGRWIDKSALVHKGVEAVGARLIFHWVVLRAGGGSRAEYSHLMGFSRDARLDLSKGLRDVIEDAGPSTWTRGMGLRACEVACEAVQILTPTRVIVDPFCGHGTILAVANSLGLDAIGIEIGRRRAQTARKLTVEAVLAAGANERKRPR